MTDLSSKDIVARINAERYPPHDQAADGWAEMALEAAGEIESLRSALTAMTLTAESRGRAIDSLRAEVARYENGRV